MHTWILFAFLTGGASDEARALDSKIVEVTVYPGLASVRREASLPAGGGSFVIAGLPSALVADGLRVKCSSGEVGEVEVRERFQSLVPDARVAELRERVRALERAMQVLRDEGTTLAALRGHTEALLRQEEAAHAAEVARGTPDAQVWAASYDYLQRELAESSEALRSLSWRIEDAEVALRDAKGELSRCEGSGGVALKDVHVDVIDTSGKPGTLEVEYLVENASWSPFYDLRAAKDLGKVELVYRAKVWQRTGEDWRACAVLLSTAAPQQGAQGPEPRARWLGLVDPRERRLQHDRGDAPASPSGDDGWFLERAKAAPAESPAPVFAGVESQGLSVRFRLPRTETVESRDEPTSVLVGRKDLAIRPEHVVVPKLDTTVWLRASAKNESEWVMLAGPASVYFGSDFLGQASLEAVQLGQEFTLHLGADAGLAVKRTQVKDLLEQPGVFGSRVTKVGAWTIEIENHGGFSARKNGAVTVIVQEILPKANDDRISIEVDTAKPALAEGERWAKLREEKGLLTWLVDVPKAGKAVIELVTEIAYPEEMELIGP